MSKPQQYVVFSLTTINGLKEPEVRETGFVNAHGEYVCPVPGGDGAAAIYKKLTPGEVTKLIPDRPMTDTQFWGRIPLELGERITAIETQRVNDEREISRLRRWVDSLLELLFKHTGGGANG